LQALAWLGKTYHLAFRAVNWPAERQAGQVNAM
jgi:hypothetical protein